MPDIDQLGELPRSYGTESLFAVAQEPHWLFTYWDVDISKHPGGPAYLRVKNEEGGIESEIEVPFETRNWYIPVQRAASLYTVELGYRRGDQWHPLAPPATAATPPDHLSASEDFELATLPLHIGFARLLGELRGAMARGESLAGALARLQREGGGIWGAVATPAFVAPGLRALLEGLLGPGVLEELGSGGLSSAEMQSRLRAALEEKLSSLGVSSWLAAGGESSLSSLFGRLLEQLPASSWGGAELTSAGLQQLSSWLAWAVTSWARAAESSGFAESLASWSRGAESSFSVSELSSWLAGALSSWAAAARPELGPAGSELSSLGWTAAALSSWARGAESSGFAESLASWARAAESSWGGASESLSSFQPAREFFMHVNAEVIFYGGTDPRARVTVDGQTIRLNPDGTFRYHFVFPNGRFEIPIVAVSPDGVETRSATLRLERGTVKFGGVEDTPQPPLGAPMGAREG